jgi:hypothetical protein
MDVDSLRLWDLYVWVHIYFSFVVLAIQSPLNRTQTTQVLHSELCKHFFGEDWGEEAGTRPILMTGLKSSTNKKKKQAFSGFRDVHKVEWERSMYFFWNLG